MRTPVIAGNWKMNKGPKDAAELIHELKPLVKDAKATVVVCVPAVDFAAVKTAIRGSKIKLGAQNVHYKESGAFTGELSAAMLKEAGVDYVNIGHSERRQYFGETDETVNLRVKAAVEAGLTPIICVGELKEQREAGYTNALVTYQTLIALTGLTEDQIKKVIIAYEPVWAIGTGLTATPAQAQEVHAFIRGQVAARDANIAGSLPILYGGSVKADNAAELFAQPDVDGGLVGGASLVAAEFNGIIAAAVATLD